MDVSESSTGRLDPTAFVPLSAPSSAALICRELAAGVVGLATRRRRDRVRVRAEYDGGYWSEILRDARWRRTATLEEFLNPSDDHIRVCKVDNRYVRTRSIDYYRLRRERLLSVMREFAGADAELVEVGCGYGANLFSLTLGGEWRRLIGLDVSEAGLSAGRQIADRFSLSDRLTFHRLDLTNPDDPAFEHLRGRTAFTYYCFEQIPHDTDAVIRNLLSAGVRRVVQIEPLAELLHWNSPKDLINYLYILRSDYQRTLLTTLRRLERERTVRITAVRRLYYAPSIRHDPAVVCWEPWS
jgi:SAM-dependent methyltransferase